MRMYFVGVTTGQSAIQRIFPEWLRLADRAGAELRGIDLPPGAEPAAYRHAIGQIRDDPQSRGALITTHKIAIVEHAGDLIDELDADARLLGEASCLVRREGRLHGSAFDLECAGWALRRILPGSEMVGRSVLILGAGGAGTALAAYLHRAHPGLRITLTDRNPRRFARLAYASCIAVESAADNDRVLARMPAGAIVVNATGMGKDVPGSPITAQAAFPADAIAWELNYRGELKFLDYARAQQVSAFDGWDYFVRGWSGITARVLDFELTPELFEAFAEAALRLTPSRSRPSPP